MLNRLAWALVVVLALYSAFLTLEITGLNPLPFIDKGHRAFGVKSEKDRAIVVELIKRTSDLKPVMTFDSGPTHQTVFNDKMTVINFVDETARGDLINSGTAISLVSSDPEKSAQEAAGFLRGLGYDAEVIIDAIPESALPKNSLVLLKSSIFGGGSWFIVYRKHVMSLPKPETRQMP